MKILKYVLFVLGGLIVLAGAAPSYKLDFGAMVTDTAKQKAKDAISGALQKRLGGDAAKGDAAKKDAPASGGSARDKLRGLFGR